MIYSIGFIGDRKYSDSYTNFGKSSPKIRPKTTAANQSNSNTAGWLLGIISAAIIIAAAIAGRKGYLGKTIQKFLGGLKKAETAPKSTESQGKKFTDNVDIKDDKTLTNTNNTAIHDKQKTVTESTIEYIQRISEKIKNSPSKIEDIIPAGMMRCLNIQIGHKSRYIAEKYPSGKPKYIIQLDTIKELDEKTGKTIKSLRKLPLIYSEYHPQNPYKKTLSVYFHEDGKTRESVRLYEYDETTFNVLKDIRGYFDLNGNLTMINAEKYSDTDIETINMYYHDNSGKPSVCYIERLNIDTEMRTLTKINFFKNGSLRKIKVNKYPKATDEKTQET